jgi:hypothetical protein
MFIKEIEKNQKEKIRVSIEEFKGHRFCDVRVYFEDESGDWNPSKKGLTIAPHLIDDVIEALKVASNTFEDSPKARE